jgi:hypothetical protein
MIHQNNPEEYLEYVHDGSGREGFGQLMLLNDAGDLIDQGCHQRPSPPRLKGSSLPGGAVFLYLDITYTHYIPKPNQESIARS